MKGLKKILPIGLVVALLLMLMPMTALAAQDTQTVTGSSVAAYTVSTTVAFGDVSVSSDKTMDDVVTATFESDVSVVVADTTVDYIVDRLTKLEYILNGATVEATINTPGTPGVQTYPVTVYATDSWIDMATDDTLDLKAYTGAVTGAWDPVEITLTIS